MLFAYIFSSSRKRILFASLFFFLYSFTFAQNPIVEENLLPGNPSSDWDIIGAGDLSIQGFATDISVDNVNTVHFKIDVQYPSTNYSIKIYRLGYYQGNGARLIEDLGDFIGKPQPTIYADTITGLTDCDGWSESASWDVPSNAVSGIYIAKLTRADNNGSSHMVFIVRNDSGNSPILFKTSDATWQAYNHYRMHSLYVGPTSAFSHAVKVSYNRPFYTRDGQGGGNGTKDWLFNAEYPMVRWLERNGYDVSYTTDLDMDRDPTPVIPSMHHIMLSVGHDEYWSAAERTKFENARDAGVHLAFFSGDEVYWKTRWEDNHRTLVCYKEGILGEYSCGGKCDPEPNTWTGLWRDGCSPLYEPNDGCRPETSLSGQISWSNSRGSIEVPAIYKSLGFWRNTSIANSISGETVTLPYGTIGDEWDAYQDEFESTYPAHRIVLSSTLLNGQMHNLSLYRHSSGALVFGAGTMQWAWGLDEKHDNGNNPPSADMQQATVNLFADMGVMPATIQSGLIASVKGDNLPPITVITNPANGVILPGNTITISGNTVDAGGGFVVGVEVSLDGGNTWHNVIGRESWIYSWQPTSPGSYTIIAGAWDDLGNLEIPGVAGSSNNKLVTIAEIYYSLFQSITPSSSALNYVGNGDKPIEVGMKFSANIDGYISGFRFYKGAGGQGTHIGNLWSNNGNNLASAIFTNESDSGWQTVILSSPVAITANTIYVVSNFSEHGDFVKTSSYFESDVVNGPLTGLGWTEVQPNGVYIYSVTPAFPNNNSYIGSSNYWTDVLFSSTPPIYLTSPTISSVSPVNNALSVSISNHPSAIFSESLDPLTVNTNTFMLTDPDANLLSGSVTYSNGTVVFTPDTPLAYSTTYVARLKGGAIDPSIKDLTGIALSSDFIWQFTTEAKIPPNVEIQPLSQNACNGSSISFYATATGIPTPFIQWQVSTDNGINWQDVPGATESLYTFIVEAGDSEKKFRAIYANSEGTTISSAATLTIIPSITASISAVSTSTCPNTPFQLQLTEANGQSPYNLVVNGRLYDRIIVGQPFTTISTQEESIWSNNITPNILAQNDGNAIELGVKFQAAVDGYIKGIRFYKGAGNTGIHTGSLWTSDGTLLATAIFTNETATGWQEVKFSIPVEIAANNTYVASYHAPVGHYSKNINYFSVTHFNGSQLKAPAENEVGGNGLYKYGTGGFPNTISADFTNYWVDPIFSYSGNGTSFINNLTSITDNGGCITTGNLLSTTVINLNSTITAAPAVSSPVTYCQYSAAAPLAASGANLLWYTVSSGGTGISNAPIPSTTIVGTTNYYVSQTVTGCESSRMLVSIIVNPTPTAPIVSYTQPNCFVATGEITISALTGSDIVYSVDGINYRTSTYFSNLSSGNYSVTAKNNDGCISAETNITIIPQPETPAIPTFNLSQPNCSVSTGIIEVTNPGAGLFFSIDGIDYTNATGFFTDISPGIYYLTAKNSSNCISPATSITLNQVPSAPDAPEVIITQPTCFISTGIISISSSLTGLSFSLNGSDYTNTTGIFTNVVPGTYDLTVKGIINNCVSPPTRITISEQPLRPSAPEANIIQPSCTIPTGTITVTSATNSLYYSIDGLDYSNTNGIFNDVEPGIYNLSTKNSNGCISQNTSVTVIAVPLHPTATIAAVGSSSCPGSPFQLQLISVTGQSQLNFYDLVINGKTYNGVSVGEIFTTINTTEESIWNNATIPTIQSINNPNAIELGVKFRAAADGYITGIRFFKGYGNSGTHTGSLWTTDGTLLANATFINETYSGWQEVRFAAPVEIDANTIYVASYYAPNGRYSEDQNYFLNTYSNNSLLQAIDTSGSQVNGVFIYDGGFPNIISTHNSNYWVDVLYSYSSSDTTFINNLTSVSENGGCVGNSTNPPISSAVFKLNSKVTAVPVVNNMISYCQFDPANPLTASGSNLLWYTTALGGIGNPIAPTPLTSSIGTVKYYVSQTLNGCESERAQIEVVVNQILTPSVSIAANGNNVCTGTPVTFTAIPEGGGTAPTYQWFRNTVAVASGETYTYVPENGDEVYAVMTSNAACATGNPATSVPAPMVVIPTVPAGVSIEVSQNKVCTGTPVTFTAVPEGGGTAPTFQWLKNTVAVASGDTYTYVPENGDEVYAMMTSNVTCTTGSPATSSSIAMVIIPAVLAGVSVDVSQNNICTGTPVTFTAIPEGGGTVPTYQWFRNTVAVASGETYTYVPENGDEVYAEMTSNAACATGNPATSVPAPMVVIPTVPAGVSIEVSQNNVCTGTPVTFTAIPEGGGTAPAYQWFRNMLAVASGETYTYVPENGDEVYAEMTSNATCATGNPATSVPAPMVVIPTVPAGVSIEVSQNNVCTGTPVTFTAIPEGGGTVPTYQWFRNTVAVASGETYTYVPENGDEVYAEMTSNAACATGNPATSNTTLITVNPLPAEAGNINGQSLICQGTVGILYSIATIVNADSYTWTVPQGAAIVSGSGTNAVTIDFGLSAESGNISVSGSNDCGNGNVSATFAVTVNSNPATPIILNDNLILSSDANSGNQWFLNGELIPGATSATYIINQTGTYSCIVKLNSCVSDTSNKIFVLWTEINSIPAGYFEVYPVPSNGIFTAKMNFPKAEIFTIEVYNALGNLLFCKKDVSLDGTTKTLIDLGTVPSGIYIVSFTSDTVKVNRKIIINSN